MVVNDLAEPAVGLAEVQAYARVETGEEEALLAALTRSASALCENFTGQVLVARPFEETLAAYCHWQRLCMTPVRSIEEVTSLAADGIATPLSSDQYDIDIDSRGDGWVRLATSVATKIRVRGTAGMALEPNGVPEPLRQGVLRLVAYLFATRDGGGGDPPAAVAALWRPYRRMRLA